MIETPKSEKVKGKHDKTEMHKAKILWIVVAGGPNEKGLCNWVNQNGDSCQGSLEEKQRCGLRL